jgi:hypothetical protein
MVNKMKIQAELKSMTLTPIDKLSLCGNSGTTIYIYRRTFELHRFKYFDEDTVVDDKGYRFKWGFFEYSFGWFSVDELNLIEG